MLQKFALSFSSSTTSHPLISSWGFSLLRHSLPPAFLVSHPISPPFITSFIFLCFLFSFWPCSDNRQKLISWTHEQARRGDEVVHERAKEWPVVAQRSKPLKLWLAEKALINSIFTFIYSRTRWVTLFLFPLMTPSLALIHDSFLPPTRNIASATTLESPLPPSLSLSALTTSFIIPTLIRSTLTRASPWWCQNAVPRAPSIFHASHAPPAVYGISNSLDTRLILLLMCADDIQF